MQRISFVLLLLSTVWLGCQSPAVNEAENHAGHSSSSAPKTPADSLYAQVMEMHDAVMPKMGKVRGAQKKAQALVDSISKLPATTSAASRSYKKELEQLISELNYADFAMDKWMMAFNLDSGKNNLAIRTAYLRTELETVSKVKTAVVESLSKAGRLLKQ